jgi:hypothetical protein
MITKSRTTTSRNPTHHTGVAAIGRRLGHAGAQIREHQLALIVGGGHHRDHRAALVCQQVGAHPGRDAGLAVTFRDLEQGAAVTPPAVGAQFEQPDDEQFLENLQPHRLAPMIALAVNAVVLDPSDHRRPIRRRVGQGRRRQRPGDVSRPRQ